MKGKTMNEEIIDVVEEEAEVAEVETADEVAEEASDIEVIEEEIIEE